MKFAQLRRIGNSLLSFKVDPALLSSALPPGSTAPELKARIHSLPGAHESQEDEDFRPQEFSDYLGLLHLLRLESRPELLDVSSASDPHRCT